MPSGCPQQLTNAARLGDVVECPKQVSPQLLHVPEVIQHGIGQVHQVVQVDGVAPSAPECHVEGCGLACMDLAADSGHAPPPRPTGASAHQPLVSALGDPYI